MTAQTLFNRLNWKQILIHAAAICFFIIAFQQFAYLINLNLVQAFNQVDQEKNRDLLAIGQLSVMGVTGFILWIAISGFIGMLLAFILSLIIAARRKWFKVNSMLALLLAYLFFRSDPMGVIIMQLVVNSSKQVVGSTGYFLMGSGLFFLSGGLLLLYLGRVKKFIEKKEMNTIVAVRQN